ncbi:MAG: ABC transporter permease [Anaerolineaceae bacterium]|jgi:ABC-2 type transport system permease protein|nr:MAG: ABC transporter permease [Anaerolineaceae bacterium]
MKARITTSFIYDSAKRGPLVLDELRGIFQYRDLVYQLVKRDIVSRYKRSILGVAWTMLNPLGTMIILTIVFSQLFHKVAGYPAYLLSGLIAWNFFSQTTSASMHQMVWGSALLHRIYMPRTVFVISVIGTGMVNLLLSLVPLLIVVLLVDLPLRWSLLFLPVSMLLLAAFALGIGLLFSVWAIYFPDIAEMYRVLLTAWMYLTPVIYPPEIIPDSYRFWLFHLNPMYYLIQMFRQPIYEGNLPPFPQLAMGTVIAMFTLVLGWIVFSIKADDFAYHT